MRVRADQVRVGQRLGNAVVTRVQPTLDWGVVRITVEHEPESSGVPVPSGTFSYLPDDILDVQRPPASDIERGLGADVRVRPARQSRPTRYGGRSPGEYRVDYQAITGGGHIVVRTEDSRTTSLVGHAQDVLRRRGIDARIRRIVPLHHDR
jgi:hypothetical protein